MVKSSAESLLHDHQRHPRLLEDRGGPARSRPGATSRCATCSTRPLSALALRAHQKGLELLCDVQATTCPTRLVGDAGRLRQVLLNLVGNAIKFTEHGEVVVQRVSAEPQTATEAMLHFGVTDTGIGIPAEKQSADLRGVHAGRRLDDAPLRRHRPGADDLVEAGRDDGRPHLGRERASARAARSISRCRCGVQADDAGQGARAGTDRPVGPGRRRQRHQPPIFEKHPDQVA